MPMFLGSVPDDAWPREKWERGWVGDYNMKVGTGMGR